jgi:hypothetical protein
MVQIRLICATILVLCSVKATAGNLDISTLKAPGSISFLAKVKVVNYRQDLKGDESNIEIDFKSDGTRFVYSQRSLDGPKDVFSPSPFSMIVTYDGAVTLVTTDGKAASLEEGLNLRNLAYLPFPGISLPGTPIVREKVTSTSEKVLKRVPVAFQVCQTPILSGGKSTRFRYMNGIVHAEIADGVPKIFELMSGLPESRIDHWKFDEHKMVDGFWIAHRAQWTHFKANPETRRSSGIDEKREYAFSNVHFDSLKESDFEPSKFLEEGALVGYVNSKGQGGKFVYKTGATWQALASSGDGPGLVSGAPPRQRIDAIVLGLLVFACGVVVVYQIGVVMLRKKK